MSPTSSLRIVLFALLVHGCGSDRGYDDGAGAGESPTANPNGDGKNGAAPGGTSSPLAPGLVGLYTVKGSDARGAYEGLAEITAEGSAFHFIRTVHWTGGLTVEGGRELHWVFEGKLTGDPTAAHSESMLRRADFIAHRGSVTRTAADVPVPVIGTFAGTKEADLQATFTGPSISTKELWSQRRPSTGKPLYANQRVFVPGHAPPSASEKASFDQLYGDYRKLPVIAPFASRPEFIAGIHGNFVDKTDFDFYQSNPTALRVAQKIIDDVSLGETLLRANAYRQTLAQKAALFQNDMETKWIDPAVGMVPYGKVVSQASVYPSGDGALWTGTFVAAMAYRYEATGDMAAIPPLVRSLDAILKLQEITGDWAHFARTLRPATGSASGSWHAGTGPYASLDWLSTGNNDMVKGLFYSYLHGWQTLCEGKLAGGYATICQRILTNAKHLADDVQLSENDTSQANFTNKLPSSWLYAAITTNPVHKIQYQSQAEGFWAAGKAILDNTPVFYHQGIVDWSGTHLTFVGDMIDILLAQRLNLAGDAQAKLRAHVDASHKNLAEQRFAVWHLVKAAFGTGAGPASPWIDEVRWRLREIPWPKLSTTIDRRISPEFCMSPNPAVPWKQDWMQYPDPDRTEGLAVYPIFESSMDDCSWKVGADYRQTEGVEVAPADFLHVYWYARRYGLLSAAE